MTAQPFTKVVNPLSDPYAGATYVKVRWDGERLSISGVEGPRSNGDAKGGAGQIVMSWTDEYLDTVEPGKLWDRDMLTKLRDVWNAWHLNDMQAGSPRQTAFVAEHRDKIAEKGRYPGSFYTAAVEMLTEAGLNPDTEYEHNGAPYKYGHAWLRVDVPEDVLDWLASLPSSTRVPAWV